MSKRKAGVNDIIYELDNEDIVISSEDEGTEPKKNRTKTGNSDDESFTKKEECNENSVEVINIEDSLIVVDVSYNIQNGGKTVADGDVSKHPAITLDEAPKPSEPDNDKSNDLYNDKQKSTDGEKTTIFNEDIVIDSPTSNSDLGVVGCENRTPLVTVRFRDSKLASNYKEQIKKFMLNLIKLHDEKNLVGSETETDLELDIWPEDLNEEEFETLQEEPVEDTLFFVDTAPGIEAPDDIPRYSQGSTIISNIPEKEASPAPLKRGPVCFNCDGPHPLRDCTLQRNNARIAENRKNMASMRMGRYHIEDEQKYGHLIPGRISGHLRHALGLKRHELPVYIYRMRLLGYPPGWLEEAKISHSGITMFDSTGQAILDPEEEEGEVCEPGSKDKFDIKKIFDFPGFNIPASSRYKEEAHLFDLPPMSEQDSKIAMLQMLAPNAMKAYKRKKLTFFPSANTNDVSLTGQAEMELDSGDEVADFPSVPPLPDEAPPPPPPPPDSPPPLPTSPPLPKTSPPLPKTSPPLPKTSPPLPKTSPPLPKTSPPLPKTSPPLPKEAPPLPEAAPLLPKETPPLPTEAPPTPTEVPPTPTVVPPIPSEAPPLPAEAPPPLPKFPPEPKPDEDAEASEGEFIEDQVSTGRTSPSLDDLEEKKRQLLSALECDVVLDNTETCIADITLNDSKDQLKEVTLETEDKKENLVINDLVEAKNPVESSTSSIATPTKQLELTIESIAPTNTQASVPTTPDTRTGTGTVKGTDYGTPVMNIASPFLKLPSDVNFAKDICDVINFENLPNSTGKYKQISSLLKKVKSEVDRIQDS